MINWSSLSCGLASTESSFRIAPITNEELEELMVSPEFTKSQKVCSDISLLSSMAETFPWERDSQSFLVPSMEWQTYTTIHSLLLRSKWKKCMMWDLIRLFSWRWLILILFCSDKVVSVTIRRCCLCARCYFICYLTKFRWPSVEILSFTHSMLFHSSLFLSSNDYLNASLSTQFSRAFNMPKPTSKLHELLLLIPSCSCINMILLLFWLVPGTLNLRWHTRYTYFWAHFCHWRIRTKHIATINQD